MTRSRKIAVVLGPLIIAGWIAYKLARGTLGDGQWVPLLVTLTILLGGYGLGKVWARRLGRSPD